MNDIDRKNLEKAASKAIKTACHDLQNHAVLPAQMTFKLGEVYVDGRKYTFQLVGRME